jgi:hypothetical protein
VRAGKEHVASAPAQACKERCAASEADGEELEALTGEERYLLSLVAGEQHDAVCKGADCFCQQHPSLFGGVSLDRQPCELRCCNAANSDSRAGKRLRAESGDGGFGTGSVHNGLKRRSKTFWATRAEEEGTCSGQGSAVVAGLEGGGPSGCTQGGERKVSFVSATVAHALRRCAPTLSPLELL